MDGLAAQRSDAEKEGAKDIPVDIVSLATAYFALIRSFAAEPNAVGLLAVMARWLLVAVRRDQAQVSVLRRWLIDTDLRSWQVSSSGSGRLRDRRADRRASL